MEEAEQRLQAQHQEERARLVKQVDELVNKNR